MLDWRGCYSEGWQGEITPEAFSHPAKFARGLIRRIYQHAVEEGWLHEGDCVIDPFGGVALGALDAMTHGLNWRGVELEPRFILLGCQNIALWNARYGGKLPRWGTAWLVQGDSRNLYKIVQDMGACVSSPPYAETEITERRHFRSRFDPDAEPANRPQDERRNGYSAAISSPPYAEARIEGNGDEGSSGLRMPDGSYPRGKEGWELRKKMGARYSAAISSPPYAETLHQTTDGIDWSKGQGGRDFSKEPGQEIRLHMGKDYGTTPGQLGAMKAGEFEASISSPPWDAEPGDHKDKDDYQFIKGRGRNIGEHMASLTDTGDTFWLAARVIVEQTYQALRPGAHAIWVVKAFVKDKKIVPFPDQWRQLCEAVGFKTIHEHRAWLVEERGTQFDLEGNGHRKKVERKSFFRRLAEQKGSPRIDWETVLCMIKE